MQAHSWGLLHWENPREDARFVEPHWVSRPKTQITLAPGHLEQTARSFDFWKIPGRKSLRHDGEHVSLTMRCGSGVLQRVRWVENLNQGDPLTVLVGAGTGFTVRSQAAQGFLRSLDRTEAKALPEAARRPSLQALTHLQIFQALDGEAAGASQRDIARRLYGSSRNFHWDADSAWRGRIRYLLKCGRARTDGGYRSMAGLGARVTLSAGPQAQGTSRRPPTINATEARTSL